MGAMALDRRVRSAQGRVMTATATDWPAMSEALLDRLGFTLLNSDRPTAQGGAQLHVALRARPTLTHFDPESIACWTAAEGRGHPGAIDRRTPTGRRTILWGHVHVVDRLGVENRFLTFGGDLDIADVTPALRVVRHASPGPIVRWGGHSQGLDDLAGEIGAFFGRLIVPVDYVTGAEARVTGEPAAHLYAAFLRDADARHREALGRRFGPVGPGHGGGFLGPWLRAEIARVRAAHPDWWAAAGRLLDDLDLGPEGLITERAALAAARRPGTGDRP